MIDTKPYYELATADGDILKLNLGTLPDEVFKQIKKEITNLGGTWKTTKKSFQFKTARAAEVLNKLQSGEVENIFQKHQFFYTTRNAWNRANEFVDIILFDGCRVLEPSCGDGLMVEYINEMALEQDARRVQIDVCESADFNLEIVRSKGFNIVGTDFLQYNPGEIYDLIIANPPFNKGQDIKHIMHMYELVADGGNIFSFASGTIMENEEFANWLKYTVVHYDHYNVEAKYFRPNKSNADTKFLTLHKLV